jgi:hypothetical protein
LVSYDQQLDVMAVNAGTFDGSGAADHDVPYRFGRRPWSASPYPFSTRQYARLLVLRSRVRESPDLRKVESAAA